jgi:hypothetical protein
MSAAANDSELFMLEPTDPKLPGRVNRAVIGIGDAWPPVFSGGVIESQIEGVRVAQAGIFDGTRNIADLAQVVLHATRDEISEIRGPVERKGSKLLAGLGAGGGFLLGTFIGVGLGDTQCGSSCGERKLLVGLLVVRVTVAIAFFHSSGGAGHGSRLPILLLAGRGQGLQPLADVVLERHAEGTREARDGVADDALAVDHHRGRDGLDAE